MNSQPSLGSPVRFDAAVASARDVSRQRLRDSLDDSVPLDEWLALASKTLRHELRLQLQASSIEEKRRLRAALDDASYGAAAEAIDARVQEALQFRAFGDVHATTVKRLKLGARGAALLMAAFLLLEYASPPEIALGSLHWLGVAAAGLVALGAALLPRAPQRWWLWAHMAYATRRALRIIPRE